MPDDTFTADSSRLLALERFSAPVLDALDEPAYVVDAAGRVVFANRAAAAFAGAADGSELEGACLDAVKPKDAGGCVDCDGRYVSPAPLAWLCLTDQSSPSRRIREVAAPIIAPDGRPLGHLHRFFDITENCRRHCIETTAERDISLLRHILDSVPDFVYAKDTELRFLFANRATCQVMGASLDELVGRTDADFYPPAMAACFMDDERRILAGGVERTVDQPFRPHDGSPGILTSFKVPVRDSHGDIIGLVGHGRDVTELRDAQVALRRRAHELSEAQRVARLMSWRWEAGGATIACSRNVADFFGDPLRGDIVAIKPLLRRMEASGRRDLLAAVRATLRQGESWPVTVGVRCPGATVLPCLVTFRREEEGDSVSLFGVCQDISEEKRIERRLHDLAYKDGLTGLINRAAFIRLLEEAVERHNVLGESAALLLIDLDRFKAVNDTLGHGAGDRLLTQVAERLTSVVRSSDAVFRLGGDEFAVVVPTVRNVGVARALAHRVLAVLRKPFVLNGSSASIGASIGIARLPEDATDGETWLVNADIALYRAKAEGRDCARSFDASLSRSQRLPFDLVADLRDAIADGTLDLHFQPQVALGSRRITGVEALARWRHPTRGMISPAEFVPLAEQSSLIADLGRYTLRRACAQWRRFAEAGHADISVSVNVSPAQLWHMELAAEVDRALAAYGMPASALTLEVTESGFLDHNRASVTETLEALGRRGVKLALDDFGTGFSNLAYLSRLPFHHLKVDRCFIDGADLSADRALLLDGMISLGHALRLQVVAEGVERPGEDALLRRLRCDIGQGYLYGAPASAADIERLLAAGEAASIAS